LLPASTGTPDLTRSVLRLLKTDLFDEVASRGVVHTLIASGVCVTGIDISPTVVAEAASRNTGLHALTADVRSLPFGDASFDAVFSGSTLDHFDEAHDVQRALVELYRVLRPGGRLVLTMDNPSNPIIRIRNGPMLSLLRRIGIVPYQVGHTLRPRELIASVRAAGFRVNTATAVMHCPRVLAVACSRLVGLMPRACQHAFLRGLGACEALEHLPTRWLTGHYIAVCATVPELGRDDSRCAD